MHKQGSQSAPFQMLFEEAYGASITQTRTAAPSRMQLSLASETHSGRSSRHLQVLEQLGVSGGAGQRSRIARHPQPGREQGRARAAHTGAQRALPAALTRAARGARLSAASQRAQGPAPAPGTAGAPQEMFMSASCRETI